MRESEQLMEDARHAVSDALDKCLGSRHTDWNKIKMVIRDAMNDYIWRRPKDVRWSFRSLWMWMYKGIINAGAQGILCAPVSVKEKIDRCIRRKGQ